jgi:hypothetical protein
MTYELLHAGFDTMDVAFAGALPFDALAKLETAREEAQERQEEVLTSIGPGNVEMHVQGSGMRGGYAYVCDTGPLGCIWRFKKNSDASQWNIFASPNATMLLAHGYEGTRDKLWQTLDDMGAIVTGHSINRADVAIDFRTRGFELRQAQFVAHSHTKIGTYWSERGDEPDSDQPGAVWRGRRAESVTIGKQPGRQIIVYNKRREATERQKYFWFDAWGVNQHDPNLEVWRVEVRAGKHELKEKYQIRTFKDFEAGIGDVITNSLDAIKYLDDRQSDSNVTRQTLHPLWIEAQKISSENLIEFRSGLTPGQIREVIREQAYRQYLNLCIGNGIGLGICAEMSDEELREHLPTVIAEQAQTMFKKDPKRLDKSIQRTRERLYFIEPTD